jgi:DNA repair protein RadD
MGYTLYPHQQVLCNDVDDAWNAGYRNVLAVAFTGFGKTVLAAHHIHRHVGKSIVIAHRQELVSQLSIACAQEGIRHNIIGPKDGSLVRTCVKLQMQRVGSAFYHPDADCTVAGVDTLCQRRGSLVDWGKSISLWVQDEAHHVQKNNKWGRVLDLFPNARGLGYTATPKRTDGHGLAEWNDGVFHAMVQGPSPRWLINNDWLTDYTIYAPPNDLDMSKVKTGADGDFLRAQAAEAVRKSTVMGDVVEHYLRLAPGKLGVTFSPDVADAQEITDRFNAAGVPAVMICAKTSDSDRYQALRKFERRDILQLINVDIFGEGFDLPAIEVVSFARPTASWALYVQQFGRALRKMDGKDRAIIIDHVGNVLRHNGPPDQDIKYSLERAEKKTSSPPQLYKVCGNPLCNRVYDRFRKVCPYCEYFTKPVLRSGPEYVDGDLEELSPEVLSHLRGKVDQVDADPEAYRAQLFVRRCPPAGIIRNVRNHTDRQAVQGVLRNRMEWWAGLQLRNGLSLAECDKMFYLQFGIDKLTAMTLNPEPAAELTENIYKQLIEAGVPV